MKESRRRQTIFLKLIFWVILLIPAIFFYSCNSDESKLYVDSSTDGSKGTLILSEGGKVEILNPETDEIDETVIIQEFNVEQELGTDEKIRYITNGISLKSASATINPTEYNNTKSELIKIKISLSKSLSEEEIKRLKVYYISDSSDELLPLNFNYDANNNVIEIVLSRDAISNEYKFVIVSNFYPGTIIEDIPQENSPTGEDATESQFLIIRDNVYAFGVMFPALPVPMRINGEATNIAKIYAYDPSNDRYLKVVEPNGHEYEIRIKGNSINNWVYFAFNVNENGFYTVYLKEDVRLFKDIVVAMRKIPVDRNFNVDQYKDLLIQYAPVLEFGDLTYLQDIKPDLYQELKTYWYACYEKEKYRPIALEDTDVYKDGYTSSLGSVCFYPETQSVEAKLFITEKFSAYPIKLQDLYRFPGTVVKNGVSRGVEYSVLGNDGEQAAQLLTIDKEGLRTKMYATAFADDKYIYLQYWFYYPYDPKTPSKKIDYTNISGTIGRYLSPHEGDAERLTVVLDKNTKEPEYVFFAHHNDDQQFAFMDIQRNLAIKWNDKGFCSVILDIGEGGIGGAIVDWDKVEKEGTHPVAYVALGSHGIYPRRGVYVVDVPNVDFSTDCSDFDEDLIEFAGGGERINYGSEDKIVIVPRLTEINEYHPLSFLYFSGGTYNPDIRNSIQSVPFFSMTEAFLFPEKKDGCKKDEVNFYCQDVDITDRLFPNEDIINIISCDLVNSDEVSIVFDFRPAITADLEFMPEIGYKIVVDWGDIQQEQGMTKEDIKSKDAGERLTYNHIYRSSGIFTPKVIFVTPMGIKVEKTCQQSITITGPGARGNLKGSVVDAVTREPLADVRVTLTSDNDELYTLETYTNLDGNYLFSDVPVGNYTLRFEKQGYMTATGSVYIEENQTYTYQTLLYIDEQHSGSATLTGMVKDAINGNAISNAYIRICSGVNISCISPVQEVYSDDSGRFSVNLDAGYYSIVISKDGYNDGSYSISVIGGIDNYHEFALSPVLSQNEVRIVLTWGDTPRDLDSHLVKIKNDQIEYHVYYADKQPTGEAYLDVDDTTSYGPETITILSIDMSATYKYYVHDYSTYSSSSSMTLANSGATVKVYFGDNVYTFNVPNEPGVAWKVFEIRNGEIYRCSENCVFDVSGPTDGRIGAMNYELEKFLFQNLPTK